MRSEQNKCCSRGRETPWAVTQRLGLFILRSPFISSLMLYVIIPVPTAYPCIGIGSPILLVHIHLMLWVLTWLCWHYCRSHDKERIKKGTEKNEHICRHMDTVFLLDGLGEKSDMQDFQSYFKTRIDSSYRAKNSCHVILLDFKCAWKCSGGLHSK